MWSSSLLPRDLGPAHLGGCDPRNPSARNVLCPRQVAAFLLVRPENFPEHPNQRNSATLLHGSFRACSTNRICPVALFPRFSGRPVASGGRDPDSPAHDSTLVPGTQSGWSGPAGAEALRFSHPVGLSAVLPAPRRHLAGFWTLLRPASVFPRGPPKLCRLISSSRQAPSRPPELCPMPPPLPASPLHQPLHLLSLGKMLGFS